METIPSLIKTNSADAGDDWIEVFQDRNVWALTRDVVDRWVARNGVFFDMIRQHVPPGSHLLETGCGPGRHAIGAATLGYKVVGIDVDERIVAQARANAAAAAPECDVAFQVGDMFNLPGIAPVGTFQAITHGGVMEHLDSARSIRETLREQLAYAPVVVFDIPFDSAKNRRLFQRDDIFRQLWSAEEWVEDVLAGLKVVAHAVDLHPEPNMTDDLVVALRA
ncbi:MAG: class I SAM-dependent methyltransferase [Acetobacteraceae bacterium]